MKSVVSSSASAWACGSCEASSSTSGALPVRAIASRTAQRSRFSSSSFACAAAVAAASTTVVRMIRFIAPVPLSNDGAALKSARSLGEGGGSSATMRWKRTRALAPVVPYEALRNPNLAVGEVLLENLLAGEALGGHRLGSLLAEADAVAVAGSAEADHALDLFGGDLHRADGGPPE